LRIETPDAALSMCQIGRMAALRILILGGYGTFGGRLARLLADEERITLIVAGRSMARAEAFCAVLSARATLTPAAFAGRSFQSTQEQGRGRFGWLLCERFGPVNAGMALCWMKGSCG
jgi:hypothetical protein